MTRLTGDAPQREPSVREVLNGVRWLVRAGAAWRLLPHALPPWYTVHHQRHRWPQAGVWEAMGHDRRAVLLPTRWGVERSSAGAARLRRLARADAPWAETRAGLHGVAVAIRRLQRFVALLRQNA